MGTPVAAIHAKGNLKSRSDSFMVKTTAKGSVDPKEENDLTAREVTSTTTPAFQQSPP
jgi:hypothetical protein